MTSLSRYLPGVGCPTFESWLKCDSIFSDLSLATSVALKNFPFCRGLRTTLFYQIFRFYCESALWCGKCLRAEDIRHSPLERMACRRIRSEDC